MEAKQILRQLGEPVHARIIDHEVLDMGGKKVAVWLVCSFLIVHVSDGCVD
jgi:hypothetical protein